MHVLRYFLFVGSILLVGIWWIGHDSSQTVSPSHQQWTALDTLRAMAHHGDQKNRRGLPFPRIAAAPRAAALPMLTVSAPTTAPNARAEAASKKIAQAQARKATAVRARKHFAHRKLPANTRIAADDHPVTGFFGFPILR